MTKYMTSDIENKLIQLRKGILELAIMGALYRERHYGYSLVRVLTVAEDIPLKEGTIYPLLGRLAKEGLVASEWSESQQGPPRKYYMLTPEGRQTYETMSGEFRRLVALVERSAARPAKRAARIQPKKLQIRRKANDE